MNKTLHLALCLSLLLPGLGCAPADPQAHQPVLVELSDVEQEDVDRSFDVAACQCQRLLLGGGTFLSSEVGGDVELAEFAARQAADPMICDTVPLAGRSPIADPGRNGCHSPVAGGGFNPVSLSTGMSAGLADGFCAAEFNYCMAQEIRGRSDSLAAAPRTRTARDEQWRQAQTRFQASAVEMASALAVYGTICRVDTLKMDRRGQECDRLQLTSYALHASSRLSDAVVQVGQLLDLQAQSAAADGDGLAPVAFETHEAYMDALWGREGARFGAAQRVMGSAEGAAYGRSGRDGVRTRSLDGAYANDYERDAKVNEALSLLNEHDLLLAITELEGELLIDEPAFGDEGRLEDISASLFNLLDHRLAASFHVPPYALAELSDTEFDNSELDTTALPGTSLRRRELITSAEFLAFASQPLADEASILRRFYGLTPEHIRRARELARNLLTTMEVDYTTLRQVAFSPTAFRVAVRLSDVRQPSSERLAAALQNLGALRSPTEDFDEVPFADPFALTDPVIPLAQANFYDFDFRRIERMGASAALHVLRVHLGQIQQTWLVRDPLGVVDPATREATGQALLAASQLIDTYVGTGWSEYKRLQDRSCICVAGTDGDDCRLVQRSADLEASSAYLLCGQLNPAFASITATVRREAGGRWDLYFDSEDAARSTGAAVLVRGEEEAYCLRFGHLPNGEAPDCRTNTSALPTFAELEEVTETELPGVRRPGAEATLGVSQRRFVVPTDGYDLPSTAGNEHATAYILWRTGEGDALNYELVDVIQPLRDASAHVFGGRFRELFDSTMAKDPSNPGRPAVSSLDLPYDLVPPLEQELTSDGDDIEESHAIYLRTAMEAAGHAGRLLREARTQELEVLRNDRADDAILAQADQAEREVVTLACGEPGGCDIARGDVRLEDLIFDGEEFLPPVAEPNTVGDLVVNQASVDPDGVPRVYIRFAGGAEPSDAGGSSRCDEMALYWVENIKRRHWDTYIEDFMKAQLSCARWSLMSGLRSVVMQDVPQVVSAELARGGSGAFSDIDGELRQHLIGQFQALSAFHGALESFGTQYQIALIEAEQAGAAVRAATPNGRRKLLCKLGKAMAIIGAVTAAVASIVVTAGASGAVIAATVVAGLAGTGSATIGVVGSGSCNGSGNRIRAEMARAQASLILALENLLGITDDARRLAGQLAIDNSRINRLQTRAELAGRRREVSALVVASNSLADVPEWRALQTFNVRRARDALTRAQRFAFVARRAIEYRLGLDLATMTTPEPFTPAPGVWANDLFVLDTASTADDDPSTPGTDHVNASAEAVEDYVQRLTDFVRGYPFARRFRDSTDTQVLRLDNLVSNSGVPSADQDVPFYQRLSYRCVDDAASGPGLGFAGEPCADAGGVASAEFSFSIPHELTGYLAERLATGNFNYRHQRVAMNIVGAAVIDCARAERPFECFGDGNLPYTIRQQGAVLVENFEGADLLFNVEPGVIQGGRALVAERVLTNPLSSVDRGLITPYLRTELFGRPLRGVYTVHLEGRPEVNWSNIETLQLLLDYRYWTRQE